MTATGLIASHINERKAIAQCLCSRTDYAQSPGETEKGELVNGYERDPVTANEEFLLAKRQYLRIAGRWQRNDVIAYQIHQSFKPSRITSEEVSRVDYGLELRLAKREHAFLIAIHTDRTHIHNHIVFSSTSLDYERKFRDFHSSGLALQRVSDIICVEYGLPIIEKKPYKKRVERTTYPKRHCFRDEVRQAIDQAFLKKPKDFEEFLRLLGQDDYTRRRGKHTVLWKEGQDRFLRFRSSGGGYTEEEIRAIILGEKEYRIRSKNKQSVNQKRLNLLVGIDARLQAKGIGYQQRTTAHNLKQMAQTMIFLREHGIENIDQLREEAKQSTKRFSQLDEKIKTTEKRLVEIASLKRRIINYAKAKDVYVDYHKSGHNEKFYKSHREAITLHKATKDAFNELGVKKLPKIKGLSAEYAEVLVDKKSAYIQYRNARAEMQDYLKAEKNVKQFLSLTRQGEERAQEGKRKKEAQR